MKIVRKKKTNKGKKYEKPLKLNTDFETAIKKVALGSPKKKDEATPKRKV